MSKIQDIIEIFEEADYQETLEILLDYSENLPELPEKYIEARDKGYNRVPECETPVFIWVDLEGSNVNIHADVPRESPTVRGFVSLLVDAFSGSSPGDIESAPNNLISSLKLDQKLGTRRMYGLSAVYNRIKRDIKRAANGDAVR